MKEKLIGKLTSKLVGYEALTVYGRLESVEPIANPNQLKI